MLLDCSVFAQRCMRGTTGGHSAATANACGVLLSGHRWASPPTTPTASSHFGQQGGDLSRRASIRWDVNVWAKKTTSPDRGPPLCRIALRPPLWSSRVDGLSTRPRHRPSSRSGIHHQVHRAIRAIGCFFGRSPPPKTLDDRQAVCSSPASPSPTASRSNELIGGPASGATATEA